MNENTTLYHKIIVYLKDKIESGIILPDEKLPTEAELSALFNVSRITSKKALEELEKEKLIYRKRGSGSYVSPKEENIATTNNENNIIAMLIPLENSNQRLPEIIHGASDVVSSNGYYLTVHNTWNVTFKDRLLIQKLYKDGIKGIIYYPPTSDSNLDLLYYLNIKNYPMVTIDKYFEDVPISYVTSDNFTGAYNATTYLQKLGHKNISYVSYSNLKLLSSLRQRYFGYCKAMFDNELPLNEEHIILGIEESNKDNTLRTNIRNHLFRLINIGVTAIHTENDNLAIEILSICAESGIKVPDQLSIIGFDNLIITDYLSTPLTTINQNFYEIGKKSAEIIIEKLKTGNSIQYKELIPTKLIERYSCKNK